MTSPGAAKDCFIRVRTAEARAPATVRRVATHRRAPALTARHHLHHARYPVGPGRVRRPALAVDAPAPAQTFAESSFEQRSMPVYVMRPTSCDSQPTLQSTPPAAFKPAAQKLLDELAGPASRGAAAPAALGPSTDSGQAFTPAEQPGGPIGGGPIGGGPIGGGPIGGGPAGGQPPITPPDIFLPPGPPPEGPPVVGPPEGGQPPVGPPIVIGPPLTPPTTGAIPEPATWGLMILGFLAVGGALRARRTVANRTP